MSASRLTVVLSQAQSNHPAKRQLEESLAAALLMEAGIDVSIIPHLYDLTEEHTGLLFLSSITGDMVVLGWLYPRATHWMLDRYGVKGKFGQTQLKQAGDGGEGEEEDEAEDNESEGDGASEKSRAVGPVHVPDRFIYSLDLRDFDRVEPYVQEIRRIAAECKGRQAEESMAAREEGKAEAAALRGAFVARDAVSMPSRSSSASQSPAGETPAFGKEMLLEPPERRRWYPVIDFSRCTNCMECIDFCLFGVYGVDKIDRILVEQPDNCKKGCPACSRVCPEHAIIFPEYKSPAIAGDNVSGPAGLKIDLSKLFGGGDALSIAARERDRELVRDGREVVGLTVGMPSRQPAKPSSAAKDDLDKLMDALDESNI